MTTPALTTTEILALVRLRQWQQDRAALGKANTTRLQARGWTQRTNRMADARIVRVLDFEKALGTLPETHQALLLVYYRDRRTLPEAAFTIGVSTRTASTMLKAARLNLAVALDRRDLL